MDFLILILSLIIRRFIMKAHVDKETCIGCGLCPSICPDVFSMNDDDGKAEAITTDISDDLKDDAEEAASSCPVEAITVN